MEVANATSTTTTASDENQEVFSKLDTQVYKRFYEKKYQDLFFEQKLRVDGRLFSQIRPTSVTLNVSSTNASSSLVKIGRSSMMAGVTLAVGKPDISSPKEGEVSVSVRFPPSAGKQYSVGQTPASAHQLTSWILTTLNRTQVVPLEDLCIVEGKSAWKIQIDLVCLDDDGNSTDVGFLASVAALSQVRLPSVDVDEDTGVVSILPDSKESSPLLALNHIPVSMTFGLFPNGIICADLTADEEARDVKSLLTIIYNADGMLCGVQKIGSDVSISDEEMAKCMRLAKARAIECKQLIE